MKYIRAALIAALLLLVSAVYAQDETPQPIDFDEVVTGTITDERPEIRYSFEVPEDGTSITALMSAVSDDWFDRLDSFLYLLDADGNEITFDDDSGGALNAFLGPQRLNAGTYIIVATRCCFGGGHSQGEFELVVRAVDVPSLVLNEPITFELDRDNPIGFGFFNSNQATSYFVRARVIAVEGEGNFQASGRGPIGQFYSGRYMPDGFSVEPVPMDITNGAYFFSVVLMPGTREERFTGSPDGARSPVTVQMIIEPVEAQEITLGESVSGTLTADQPVSYYTFNVDEASAIRAELRGGGDDGLAIEGVFHGPDGMVYNSGATSFDDTFFIDPLAVPRPGQQLILIGDISDIQPGQTSNYTLTLSESQTPVIQLGETIEGQTSDSYEREVIYAFDGEAGQTITVSGAGLGDNMAINVDIQLPRNDTLEQMAGGSLLGVYGNTPNNSFEYTVVIPVTGRYFIRINNGVFNFDGPLSGAFTLTIDAAD